MQDTYSSYIITKAFGKKFIEYIGRSGEKAEDWYPKLKAEYSEGKITAKAIEKTSERIEKIELIYRGGLAGEKTGNSSELAAEFDVTQTGWYIIRATSSTGKQRYAWVRAANTLLAPKIEINTSGEQENGWYGKDNVAVTVKITASSESTKGIYYSLDRWSNEEYVEGKTAITGDINKAGLTIVYAYAVDKDGNESEIVNLPIYYDNIPPVVKNVEITGEQGENNWYRGNVGISMKNVEDANSGVLGYYYYVLSNEEIENKFIPSIEEMLDKMLNKEIISKDDPMIIEEDGIKTILVKVRDRAGNISGPATIKVKRDNTPPEPLILSYKDVTAEGFTLNTGTTDNLSSVTYDFYVIEEGEPRQVRKQQRRRMYCNRTKTK